MHFERAYVETGKEPSRHLTLTTIRTVDHPRADDPDEVVGNLAALGADTFAWYGVQLFTDHWDDFKLSENFESILSAEEQAGRREPYRRLAAATHVVARRRSQYVVLLVWTHRPV